MVDVRGKSIVVRLLIQIAIVMTGIATISCGGSNSSSPTPVPPSVTTLPASDFSPTSATLNGTVVPNGQTVEAWFEWGTDSTLASSTPTPHQTGITTSGPVSHGLTALAPGGTYYFRVAAKVAGSTSEQKGSILRFDTSTLQNISLPQSQVDFGSVVLNKFSEKEFVIQNTGGVALAIGQIGGTDNLAAPFSIPIDNCSNRSIPPSSSCSMAIRFSPTVQGDFSDAFDIPSDDPDAGSITASFGGSGKSLDVSINRITVNHPTVELVLSVTDSSGDPVIGLDNGSFTVFENGQPQNITSFSNVIKSPVSVGMVLDYSSSMQGEKQSAMETGAKAFVDQLDTVGGDEAEVIKFADNVVIMQPFTSDKVALKASIDQPPPFFRLGTRLFDAIWISINSTSARSNKVLAVIAITDGVDSSSDNTASSVIDFANEKNVFIFTIGIGGGLFDEAALQQIAAETGGQYFFAPTSADIPGIYAKISEILSNQYTIEYVTSSPAGSTVTIDIFVDDGGLLGEHSRSVILQ